MIKTDGVFGPMIHRPVDLGDQCSIGLLIIRTNDLSDHWPLYDTSEYRPFEQMTLRTTDQSDQWYFGLLTISTNDLSDYWSFGPMTPRTIDLSDQCYSDQYPSGHWSFWLMTLMAIDHWDQRPFGLLTIRTNGHSENIPVTETTRKQADRSDIAAQTCLAISATGIIQFYF